MKKVLIVLLTIGLSLGFVALAKRPADAGAGGQCVQAGIAVLQTLPGGVPAAAKKQIDYSAFADPENGPIRLELAEGSFLSLGTVVSLHATNPSLFAWCD